jgi:nucleoside 2-deoxyribosyltransferase
MPAFKNITTIAEYLTAQERIISDDPFRHAREWKPALPATELPGLRMPRTAAAVVSTASDRAELFVIMPFTEPWSEGTYAFIRRTVRRIVPSTEELSLYRADEIAKSGQITQQVKEAIAAARVVIADVTHMNPNVMWELGYADGLGKTIVILNQDPGTSPFDMVDRRQVAYNSSPTEKDEENLLRHLIEALQTEDRK